jgi:hypothetical protein
VQRQSFHHRTHFTGHAIRGNGRIGGPGKTWMTNRRARTIPRNMRERGWLAQDPRTNDRPIGDQNVQHFLKCVMTPTYSCQGTPRVVDSLFPYSFRFLPLQPIRNVRCAKCIFLAGFHPISSRNQRTAEGGPCGTRRSSKQGLLAHPRRSVRAVSGPLSPKSPGLFPQTRVHTPRKIAQF